MEHGRHRASPFNAFSQRKNTCLSFLFYTYRFVVLPHLTHLRGIVAARLRWRRRGEGGLPCLNRMGSVLDVYREICVVGHYYHIVVDCDEGEGDILASARYSTARFPCLCFIPISLRSMLLHFRGLKNRLHLSNSLRL